MNKIWIQYSYDDTEDAAILQCASSEEEAREDNELIMEECPWYCYDQEGEEGELTNEDGPYYFNL